MRTSKADDLPHPFGLAIKNPWFFYQNGLSSLIRLQFFGVLLCQEPSNSQRQYHLSNTLFAPQEHAEEDPASLEPGFVYKTLRYGMKPMGSHQKKSLYITKVSRCRMFTRPLRIIMTIVMKSVLG